MERPNRRAWTPILAGTIVLVMLGLRHVATDPIGDRIRIRWTAGAYRTIGPQVVEAGCVLDGLPILAGIGLAAGVLVRTAVRDRPGFVLLVDGLTMTVVAGTGFLLALLVGLNVVIG